MIKLLNSKEIREEIAEKQAEADAIIAVAEGESRELTKDEAAAFDAIAGRGKEGEPNYLAGEISELKVQLARAERREEIAAEQRQARKIQERFENGELSTGEQESKKIVVPARAKAHGRLKAFDNEKDAYIAGNAILAGIYGNEAATKF
ncbi:hypothetical protein, partial [Stieleria sp.]|uniref:hypothetical protein n=1 Tax=Stieleria sp. TaxID=2795976 RepID=UPI00356A51A6